MTLPQVYDILLLATWKSSESFKTAEEKNIWFKSLRINGEKVLNMQKKKGYTFTMVGVALPHSCPNLHQFCVSTFFWYFQQCQNVSALEPEAGSLITRVCEALFGQADTAGLWSNLSMWIKHGKIKIHSQYNMFRNRFISYFACRSS